MTLSVHSSETMKRMQLIYFSTAAKFFRFGGNRCLGQTYRVFFRKLRGIISSNMVLGGLLESVPLERIRIGKELLEAKRIEEENERKRLLALKKVEKEEEKRAREKIKKKLEEDKAERRRRLGLPPEEPSAAKPSPAPIVEEKKSFVPVRPATKAEQMRECLRSLKQNHKEDDARVKRAFQTLLTYVGNVARNPDEEKFRKIRLSNQSFQDRVGSLKGGIEFLEICGFEKIDGGEFLFLPRDKVEMAVLNSAGSELDSAIKNPFFGVL
ncbi:UBX domain-containing protein 6 [Glycine soja]